MSLVMWTSTSFLGTLTFIKSTTLLPTTTQFPNCFVNRSICNRRLYSSKAANATRTNRFRNWVRIHVQPLSLSGDNVPQPPLAPPRSPRSPPVISYGQVLEQAAQSLQDLVLNADTSSSPSQQQQSSSVRLTIDFPPERSETRAGTLVSRYENNLNFLSALASRLGCDPSSCEQLGPPIEIRDNVNPQGGGEYITDDECMIGLRLASCPLLDGRRVSLLLNAGVDAATLKQIQKFDDNDYKSVIVLVNCALDRVSWFAKIGFAKYLDSFQTAYSLKSIAPAGWLLKCGTAPWTAFVNAYNAEDAGAGAAVVVQQFETRPSIVDVEAKIRLYVSSARSS